MKPQFIKPGDIKSMVGWLEIPKNHNDAVDAVSFAPDMKKDDAFVDFIAGATEFQGWERDQIQAAIDRANDLNLMETKKMKTKKPNTSLTALIAEAVHKGLASAVKEKSAPKTVKITSTQLAEGVRKAVKLALKEGMGMPGGAMPAPGKGAGAGMAGSTQEGVSSGEGQKRGTSTAGTIPSPEDLQQALDDQGGWSMTLRGSDSTAFESAVNAADMDYNEAYSMMNTGEGMHKVLTALMDSGDPEAESLASSILDVLGWEWV